MQNLPGLVALVALSIVVVTQYLSSTSQARSVHALARRLDLALEDEGGAEVARRLRARERAGAIGGLVLGWGAYLALVLGTGLLDQPAYGIVGALLGYVLGHAVGYGVVAWRESTRRAPGGGPRMARASTPAFEDYVAPFERRGAWAAAAVSALVGLGLAAVHLTGEVDLGSVPWAIVVVTVVVPALFVVAAELAARRLLQRPQVAATTLELAWDDALRSRTLRDVVTVPIVTGVLAPFLLLAVLGDQLEGGWPANPAVGLVSGLVFVLLGATAAMALASVVLDPQGHVRRRLWPRGERPAAPRVTGPAGEQGGAR